ncbi:MAG TPA: SusD/RagB family nutrient-binding outer membrane lipoprotein [Gemmatimonadales bacterium]|nr:SusD/RagB family nutrient-binding outer membrane lipoprotein [Gemmatimonadales bacterium]
MRHSFRFMLSAALAISAAGCGDYLSGPGVDQDPNNITKLTRPGPLYIGIQALQSVQFEGQIARNAAEYVQQVAGISRQQIGYDLYGMDPSTIDPEFYSVYGSSSVIQGGGGLLDIRKMQQLARAANDSIYLGIGKVYEALVMGMAASVWGDIPYRQAADSNNLTPAFDPQLQVYSDVLTQLDSAIMFLAATPAPPNAGPPSDNSELIYLDRAGDAAALAAVYTQVAHSLKARYHMHLAEVDPSHYALALAEVPLGINTPTNDMLWFHDQSPNGQNIWWQFMNTRTDIGPGAAIIEIMKRRIAQGIDNDERLNFYFQQAVFDPDPNTAGDEVPLGFIGYRPGASRNLLTAAGIYNGSGSAPGAGGPSDPGGNYSLFNFIDQNTDPGDVRMPIITYAETQLIGAEAAFQTGGQGAAQPFLDAARAQRSFGARGTTPIVFTPLSPVPATLQNIMEEKYVTLFLNIEAWNDYKRTCLPALAPAPTSLGSTTPGTNPIPGRLPYGITEINANPNTPNVSPVGRNANDPNPCPVLNYSSSTPLGN